MTKSFCLFLTLTFSCISLFAQEGFKIGAHAGMPIGDYNDFVSVVIGADVGYMWAPNKAFDLGVKAGIIHGFAETFTGQNITVDYPSVQFLPLAASIRLWPSKTFSIGGDIGNAFGLNEGNDGGFYYRPQIGFQVGPKSELNFSYTGITINDSTWNTVTMGFVYTFLSARHFR
ncbi:outer membrane beta-barrel protein [Zobellia russellii]|uniref:outer membrane beta-barrel protein n=1 Tax=Zobellia russellii TaxID=248907 RepID=UPI001BFFAF4F|nr:outer membrane beta-barrel protein [Zobellia russellii]MBT9189640.1 outer membrane beta-barrel protein [Zobellia russellii]